jgi:outer membrane protein TolC
MLMTSGTVSAQERTYTLTECIDKALKTDLTLIRTQNGEKQAKADKLAAIGAFLPSIDFNLDRSFTKTNVSREFDDYTFSIRDTNYNYKGHGMRTSLSASMLLFNGFGNVTNLGRASADLTKSRFAVSQQQLQTVYNVKEKYFSLLNAQAQYEIRQKALERSQERMKIAETRYELGSASRSDVLKAQVSLSEAQLDLLTAENSVKSAQANLAYAIGEPIDRDIVVEDIEPTDISYSQQEITDQALMNNPDYKHAQADERSKRYAHKYALRNYLPTVSVGVTKQWNQSKSDRLPDYSWFKSNDLTYWGSVSLNIFNGFATKSQASYAKANLHSAEYAVSDTRRAVERESRDAFLYLQQTIKARELSAERFASAEEDYKLAQEKYTLGAATILDILDAEVSLKQAESFQISSKYDYLLAVARLKTVMGIID